MTEITIYRSLGFDKSCDLTNDEKNKLKLSFDEVLKEFNLIDRLKTLNVSYPTNEDIKESNQAQINCNEQSFQQRIAEFVTFKKYILNGDKVNIPLIRHELMHLKDMFDPEFEFSHKKEPKEIKLRGAMMLVWNIYIDSRLIEVFKLESSRNKDYRKKEFKEKLREAYNEAWFEKLWEKRNVTFESLINEGRKVLEKLS